MQASPSESNDGPNVTLAAGQPSATSTGAICVGPQRGQWQNPVVHRIIMETSHQPLGGFPHPWTWQARCACTSLGSPPTSRLQSCEACPGTTLDVAAGTTGRKKGNKTGFSAVSHGNKPPDELGIHKPRGGGNLKEAHCCRIHTITDQVQRKITQNYNHRPTKHNR